MSTVYVSTYVYVCVWGYVCLPEKIAQNCWQIYNDYIFSLKLYGLLNYRFFPLTW